MKDKTAEKVMELYEKGVKQNVIAQQLNLSTAKVWRIINKNVPKEEDANQFTDEDYEAYDETVNGSAADDNSADDSASENSEIPSDSSEDDSAVSDDNSADNFTSENPEIPGNSSEEDFPEQMRTIAELTSAETARKMTESYKEVMDLMGSVTREIMENSLAGMDKATRMLLTASERLNEISEKQEKQLAANSGDGGRTDLHTESGNGLLYLVSALMLQFAVFSFGGICGMCDMLYVAIALCGVLIAVAVILCVFYSRPCSRKQLLAFSILAIVAGIPAMISGYFFFLIEKSVMHLWMYALAGVPAGGLICLGYFIMRNHSKSTK